MSYYYNNMRLYALSREMLHEYGFPLEDCPFFSRLQIKVNDYFGDSNAWKQKCRCGETLSLMIKDWFCTKNCRYHPLKVDKENSWRYKCCGRPSKSPGCVSGSYHVSSYIPLDGKWFMSNREETYKFNIFSLDCEFVFTIAGMEVARVSLVSLQKGVVYDTFVRPKYRILDHNTQFSGVTPENLKHDNVKTLAQVQYDLTYKFLSVDTIVVGHSLHTDFKGLHISHDNIIDTAILYPHHRGFPFKYSLEYLAKNYLGISIHNKESGHCSIEDAKICLQLALLKCGLLSAPLQNVIMGFK